MESSAHSLLDSPRNRSEAEALPADFQCDASFAAANHSAHRSKSDPIRHPSTTPSSHTHRGRSHFRLFPPENARNPSRSVHRDKIQPNTGCAPVNPTLLPTSLPSLSSPTNNPLPHFQPHPIRPVHDRETLVRRCSISLNRRMKTVRPFHTTLLRTRPILLNRPASPYRIHIFRQYFIHARRRPRRTSRSHTSRSCSRLAGFRHPTCGIRRARKRRNISCPRDAPMARVACYFPPPVEIILVDCKHHLHHVARPLLGRLVIVIKVVCFVAVVATHTQRSRYVPHRRHQLASGNILQHLNILESLTGSLLRLRPTIAPGEHPTHEGARGHSN